MYWVIFKRIYQRETKLQYSHGFMLKYFYVNVYFTYSRTGNIVFFPACLIFPVTSSCYLLKSKAINCIWLEMRNIAISSIALFLTFSYVFILFQICWLKMFFSSIVTLPSFGRRYSLYVLFWLHPPWNLE